MLLAANIPSWTFSKKIIAYVQALQHGAGKCERDVDRAAQNWKRKEEGERLLIFEKKSTLSSFFSTFFNVFWKEHENYSSFQDY